MSTGPPDDWQPSWGGFGRTLFGLAVVLGLVVLFASLAGG